MKKLIGFTFLFSVIGLFLSCGNEVAQKTEGATKNPVSGTTEVMNYEAMAEGLCKCMTPMMDVQKKIAALSAEGKTDEIQAMLTDVEALTKEGDKCVGALEAKYGEVAQENEAKANAAFKKACPEVAAILQDSVE